MYGKEVLILSKKETPRALKSLNLQQQAVVSFSPRSRGMSWADKRISLPSFRNGGQSSLSLSHSEDASSEDLLPCSNGRRSIRKNLVLTGSLRKLRKNKLKWFVLYEDEPGDPANSAHLEYHDDEKKWRSGFSAKRRIYLNQCLNICRKQDSRDSKNKKVIALYTLEDCVGLLFDQEEELRIWLDLLLSHQQGRNSNGKIPKPNYEHMWQVKVRNFQPESKNSLFSMNGGHRLCVTSNDVKFFPVGSGEPIVFPVDCIRNCATVNRLFRLETGRSSVSGPGHLVIECEDKEIANKINVRVLSSMRESETDQHGGGSGCRSAPTYNSQQQVPRLGSNMCCSSSRPRSESWSNHEKPTASAASSAPNSSMKFPFIKDSKMAAPSPSSSSMLGSNMRYRTTSEGGGHFEASNALKHHRRPFISSSPNSPGPGSFLCSSESAGSSNSIEEAYETGGKLLHPFSSLTPDSNHVTEATIYEESSGESAQDVDRSKISCEESVSELRSHPYISSGKEEDEYTGGEEYMDMSSVVPVETTGPHRFSHESNSSPTSTASSFPKEDLVGDMNIPLSDDFSSSYVTMSPVSLDIDKLKSIEEECFSSSLPRPPPSRLCKPSRSSHNHHRNSYCSSSTERWSPGGGDLPIDPDFPLDPDSNYVPLDFGLNRRISPASSCSLISGGTPSSLEPDKVVSQIIGDEDLLLLPSRAYSIGSRPEKPPLPGGGGKPRSASRVIDIPISAGGGKQCCNKSSSSSLVGGGGSSSSWLKQQQSPSGHSPSSIMSWIRQRTGSVPSRPPFFERRRHRTQSEGEKDNNDDLLG